MKIVNQATPRLAGSRKAATPAEGGAPEAPDSFVGRARKEIGAGMVGIGNDMSLAVGGGTAVGQMALEGQAVAILHRP